MLTSEAKKLLAETIRGTAQDAEKGLRGRLLRTLHDEADRRYRLSVSIKDAKLDEAHRIRRERLEAWVDERARATKPKNKAEHKAAEERLLRQAEKEAAATFLNRLVLLRHLEALGLSRPAVLTGGWKSLGYREFREFAPGLVKDDETEGYAALLGLIFDELAIELPGLFGDVGLTSLFPIPAAALRECVERLDVPGLASAWTDDTTLGWVYQYWNDPDREALDAKINGGGKIEPHEIASKTQMFTERYMVEWLLQNSLGLTWLSMCEKHKWTPDADQVLGALDLRRAEWRKKREAGEVELDALMPVHGELEEQWKYYVPQPIPEDAVTNAPDSLRALKLLDPACGSGHFLVIAFGMLASLYKEEARHTGRAISEAEIAESILENNLFGIDIDPRAIQIAAAAVYLKGKSFARDARPKKVNLVAPVLSLGNLPPDDPALTSFEHALVRECGIPIEATKALLKSLASVHFLGSLLKVDASVDEAIRDAEKTQRANIQRTMFDDGEETSVKFVGKRQTVVEKLEVFLAEHSNAEDLGLRLDGEQLAAGVRFVRMAREGTYDIVVGNPPYQGISKTASFEYVAKMYPKGKADLCTAFLERSLVLTRRGGISAMLAMRAWMFLGQFTDLRSSLLSDYDLRVIGDLDKGAFESMTTSQLISVAMTTFRASPPDGSYAVALQPTAPGEKYWGPDRTDLKRAAILVHRGRYEFDPRGFEVIEGEPIVYWWSKEFLAAYDSVPKLGAAAPARIGLRTSDNGRYLRNPWEVRSGAVAMQAQSLADERLKWIPYVKGAAGKQWIDPLASVIDWGRAGLAVKVALEYRYNAYPQSSEFYLKPGVAFTMIGAGFAGRAHRAPSVIGDMGASAYPKDIAACVCLFNSSRARFVLESLNPTIHFQPGDVARLPLWEIDGARAIFDAVSSSFAVHEAHREASVEYRCPGPSPWQDAQAWAQAAIDRPAGNALPPQTQTARDVAPSDIVSFAIGVALRRFDRDGAGILTPVPGERGTGAILFASVDQPSVSMDEAGRFLVDTWSKHGEAISPGDDLSTYLRRSFFDYHKKLYENRPIYFPLSSAKKSFVAYVSIHRWQDDTLSVLLADHLVPTKRRLEGELEDLRAARASQGSNAANKGKAEKRFAEVQRLLEELNDFIGKVTEIAEKGPPPVDDKTTRREVDAKYQMDLDDGVMVNSAALWPLLEPQWKDPKKWWKELANAQGKKDYDWSHLAARYFPARVRKKCEIDPSLGVAHKCFWELHPAKAYAWELRLQDEIRPDFTIDEPGSDAARAKFLAEHAAQAAEIAAKEKTRRERKAAKAADASAEDDAGPLFEGTGDGEEDEGEAADA